MSDTSTLGIVLGFIGVLTTQTVVYLLGRSQSKKTDGFIAEADAKIDIVGANADTAAEQAAIAAKRAEPVSNGFANKVTTGISEVLRIQALQSEEIHEVHKKIDRHIEDHATSDVLRKGKEDRM